MQAFYILKMESAAKFVHDNTLPNVEEKPIHVPYVKKHNDIEYLAYLRGHHRLHRNVLYVPYPSTVAHSRISRT